MAKSEQPTVYQTKCLIRTTNQMLILNLGQRFNLLKEQQP